MVVVMVIVIVITVITVITVIVNTVIATKAERSPCMLRCPRWRQRPQPRHQRVKATGDLLRSCPFRVHPS